MFSVMDTYVTDPRLQQWGLWKRLLHMVPSGAVGYIEYSCLKCTFTTQFNEAYFFILTLNRCHNHALGSFYFLAAAQNICVPVCDLTSRWTSWVGALKGNNRQRHYVTSIYVEGGACGYIPVSWDKTELSCLPCRGV